MYKMLTTYLTVFFLAAVANAQQSLQPVEIQSNIRPLAPNEAELVIRANIATGLHIYAQSQPKPFLATKFTVEATPEVTSVGEFVSSKEPLRMRHEDLGVELHEHEGSVEWRARIRLHESAQPGLTIKGTVFAQACEAGRCFAPQTYPFAVRLESNPSAPESRVETTVANADSTRTAEPFSLDNLTITPTETKTAWSVLPLALVAGFLLNFMPCVLPVVGLKLLSFAEQANSDRKQILLMNVAYTAGLMSVMLILATLAVFAGLGWGEQFSSATFTVVLSAVVFAFGLSFLGVWEIPLPGFVGDASGNAKQEGYGGAFSKGILSTLLATPCSGPFLGAALAWAVTQPTYLTYAVFAAVGLGMASPYLFIGFFPSAIRFLPKPGNWMVGFKQIMGFIMLGTVVYLMSFMPVATVLPTILLLLGVGIAVWYAGKTPVYAAMPRQAKAWFVATVIIAATAFASFGWLQGIMQSRFERAAQRLLRRSGETAAIAHLSDNGEHEIQWETYSAKKLEELVQAGQPVFIDFTADWCLTCKSNEAAAVDTPEFATALAAGNVVALRADKTEPNAEVDDLLRKLGNSAASIPYYAFFPANEPSSPILLDGIFASPNPFVAAAEKAASQSRQKNSEAATGEQRVTIRGVQERLPVKVIDEAEQVQS